MRKWKYTTLGHLGTVTTELDGDTIEMEPGTEVYPASDVDARIADLELAAKENARYSTEMREEFKRRGERIVELEMQLAEAKGHIETLDRSNDRLRQKLDRLSS